MSCRNDRKDLRVYNQAKNYKIVRRELVRGCLVPPRPCGCGGHIQVFRVTWGLTAHGARNLMSVSHLGDAIVRFWKVCLLCGRRSGGSWSISVQYRPELVRLGLEERNFAGLRPPIRYEENRWSE